MILFQLIRMFNNTKFINKMLTVLFLFNSLASLLTFIWLFDIAYLNLISDDMAPTSDPSDHLLEACSYYIVTLFSSQVILVAGNAGISFCRFIYIRHTTGLVREGRQLFHRLVIILITCLPCNFFPSSPFQA